jgi:carbon monoxide dehydrogenase subunit G
MAVTEFEYTADVAAPAAATTTFLADARHDPLWKGGITAVELTEGQAGEVGSRYRVQSKVMGMTNTIEVVLASVEPLAIRFDSLDKVVRTAMHYAVEPTAEGCRVTARVVLEAAAPIANMVGRMLRAQLPKDMQRLPQHVEAAARAK